MTFPTVFLYYIVWNQSRENLLSPTMNRKTDIIANLFISVLVTILICVLATFLPTLLLSTTTQWQSFMLFRQFPRKIHLLVQRLHELHSWKIVLQEIALFFWQVKIKKIITIPLDLWRCHSSKCGDVNFSFLDYYHLISLCTQNCSNFVCWDSSTFHWIWDSVLAKKKLSCNGIKSKENPFQCRKCIW